MPVFEQHPNYGNPFNVRLAILLRKYNLTFNISPSVVKKAPWQLANIEFCKDLTMMKKKDVTNSHFCSLFREHFSEHENCVPIFTDGSKCEEGVGLAVILPDTYISRRLPKEPIIITAELYAILLALQQIMIMNQNTFVIVSDSQSALLALEKFNPVHPIVCDIQEWYHLVTVAQKQVQFCWVPSHVGVRGNEIADEKAKAAVHNRNISNKTLPYTDYYPAIDLKLRNHWQNEWRNENRNKLLQIKSTVAKWSSSVNKNRQWEVVLTRLRVGHTRLTHGYLMEGKPAPLCNHCNIQLTVQHILINCPLYTQQRNHRFRHLDVNTLTLKKLLEESDTFDVSKIIAYLKDIDVLNKI